MPIVGLPVVYFVGRKIYHELNPEAKRAHLERKAEQEAAKKAAEESEIERLRAWRQEVREEAEKIKKEEREETEKQLRLELERKQHRDADQQATPYIYQIGKHGNESLAIRYGIANQQQRVKEYWYYGKGGERKRDPDRDRIVFEPANTIRLQKAKKVKRDLYEVLLVDFRNRKARAVIESGAEYVKTFYPMSDDWFDKYADLELTLKGSNTFTLKELATFHVQKVVGT